jgi:hypothetical protein
VLRPLPSFRTQLWELLEWLQCDPTPLFGLPGFFTRGVGDILTCFVLIFYFLSRQVRGDDGAHARHHYALSVSLR